MSSVNTTLSSTWTYHDHRDIYLPPQQKQPTSFINSSRTTQPRLSNSSTRWPVANQSLAPGALTVWNRLVVGIVTLVLSGDEKPDTSYHQPDSIQRNLVHQVVHHCSPNHCHQSHPPPVAVTKVTVIIAHQLLVWITAGIQLTNRVTTNRQCSTCLI